MPNGVITGTGVTGDRHQESPYIPEPGRKPQAPFFCPLPKLFCLNHLFTKGHQGYLHQLEVLACKRYPYNGDKQQRGKYQVYKGCIQSPAQEPNDVEENGNASHATASEDNFPTKRPQHETGNHKTLQPERDNDNRTTEQKSAENITECGNQCSK